MTIRADGVRVAHPLFQAEGGGSTPTSALQLVFRRVTAKTAVELNRLWHSRLPTIRNADTGGECYAAEFDGVWFASAIWTNPVARLLPQRTCMELRRMAIAPDAPKNTASRMLAWMVRDIVKARPWVSRLVSYQDTEVHTGTIYKAAGWVVVETPDSQTKWDMPARSRPESQSTAPKRRWEKLL